MSTEQDRFLLVTVTDRGSMDRQLDQGVSAVRELAMQESQCGILVTQHGYDRFSIKLSDAVPFGLPANTKIGESPGCPNPRCSPF